MVQRFVFFVFLGLVCVVRGQDCDAGEKRYWSLLSFHWSCGDCSRGYYQNENDHTHQSCKDCVAGKYTDQKKQSGCKDCQSGHYNSQEEQRECKACPLGWYQNQGGQLSCKDCTSTRSTYQTASTKVDDCLCPLGKYSPSSTDECIDCSAGQYSNEIGLTSDNECQDCSAGKFSSETGLANDDQCISCPAGQYSDEMGLASDDQCQSCSAGRFSSETGLTSDDQCQACSAGQFSSVTGSTSNNQCQDCSAGKFSSETGLASDDRCENCPTGRYSIETGIISDCTKCPRGFYSDQVGLNSSSDCKPCSTGRYSDQTGLTLLSECKICSTGFFQSENGADTCEYCGRGQYQDQTSQQDCKNCTVGTFMQSTEAQECQNCPIGFFQPAKGQDSCRPCKPGYYQDEAEKMECKPCVLGSYNGAQETETISNLCTVCPSGQYQNVTGQSTCKKCVSGRYRTAATETEGSDWQALAEFANDASDCLLCESGLYAKDEGSTKCHNCSSPLSTLDCLDDVNNIGCTDCTGCVVGKHVKHVQNGTCEDCVVGRYSDQTQQFSCKACPLGKYSNDTASSSCKNCPSGYYDRFLTSAFNISCLACPKGKYQSEQAQSNCADCPLGKYNPFLAVVDAALCTSCNSGRYSVSKPATNDSCCIACESGKSSSNEAATTSSTCESCHQGRYAPNIGLPTCFKCEPGKSQHERGKTTCKECEPGTYSTKVGVKHLSCTECPGGWSQSHPGSVLCQRCRSGLYLNQSKGIVCKDCEAGLYSNEYGKYGCIACPVGFEAESKGQKQCNSCPSGQYQSEIGKSCHACPAGYHQMTEASLNCSSCPHGYFQPSQKGSSCLECNTGYYSTTIETGEGRTECNNCPLGYYSDENAQLSCEICPAGWTSNGRSQDCFACKQGQYGLVREAVAGPFVDCEECPAGYSQSTAHQISCDTCNEGTFSVAGRTRCTFCPAGWAAPEFLGNGTCSMCPSGYKATTGSAMCDVCVPGYASIAQSDACAPCSPGKYQNVTGAAVCQDCDTNDRFYQDSENATVCKQCPSGFIVIANKCEEQGNAVAGTEGEPEGLSIHVVQRSDGKPGSTLRFNWNWNNVIVPDHFVLKYILSKGGPLSCGSLDQQHELSNELNGTTTNGTTTFIDIKIDTFGWCNPLYKSSVYAVVKGEKSKIAVFVSQVLSSKAARRCDSSKYQDAGSKDPTEWSCKPCPVGASCQGPVTFSEVRALFGFYRLKDEFESNGNVTFVPCRFPPSCLGAVNPDLVGKYLNRNNTDPATISNPETCNVEEGYQLYCNEDNSLSSSPSLCRVCGTCRSGYSRELGGSSYRCLKCPENSQTTIALLVFSVFLLLCIVVVLVLNAMADAGQDLASDALQKIMVNYLQAAAIALSFPLKWPAALVTYFNMEGAISTVGDFLVNPDCQLSSMSASSVFYGKLLAYAVLPFVLVVLCYVWWRIVALCIRNVPWSTAATDTDDAAEGQIDIITPPGPGIERIESDTKDVTNALDNHSNHSNRNNMQQPNPDPKDQFILSVVIFMYLIYPTLCKQVFRLFTCVEIGSKWYLSADLQVECFVKYHLTVVLVLGVPQLLLYIFGLPFVALGIMYRYHSYRSDPTIKYRFGVLYSGYRPGMLYWEVAVALRKVLVAGLAVLVSEVGVSMQIHLGMFVLMFSLIAHLLARPFVSRWSLLEKFETASLVICWITLWSGIVYIENVTYSSSAATTTSAMALNTVSNTTQGLASSSTAQTSSQTRVDLTTVFIVLINSTFLFAGIIIVIHQKLVDAPGCCKGIFQTTTMGRKFMRCLRSSIPLVDHSPLMPVQQNLDLKKVTRRTTKMKKKQKAVKAKGKSIEMVPLEMPQSQSPVQKEEDTEEDHLDHNNPLDVNTKLGPSRFMSMDGRTQWTKYWDEAQGLFYYHSETDGTIQWDMPEH